MGERQEKIEEAVANLELDEVGPMVAEALDAGEEATALLGALCQGMARVGKLFEEGEYYLADLVLAGEVMKEGLEVLEPHLEAGDTGQKGTVVMCTVKGDVHDIGKNLVCTMLSSSGYNVVDLGVNVPEEAVVEAVRKHGAGGVGLSVLLTSMVESISDVVGALESAGVRDKVKIVIGGACTTDELAAKMGVDALGRDAVEAVGIFDRLLSA